MNEAIGAILYPATYLSADCTDFADIRLGV